jgi:(p)ppGpp synthase/HD superfamily hydrolase
MCYANAANKKMHKTNGDKDKKSPGEPKKNEIDSNATHINEDDAAIMSKATSLGATDSMSTALAPCCQKVVNDDRTVSMVTDGMFAQLCLDLNNKVDDPDALLAKFKAACVLKRLLKLIIVCMCVMFSQA